MKKTHSYNLNLPEQDDFYDVDDFNENTIVIDETLNNKQDINISLDDNAGNTGLPQTSIGSIKSKLQALRDNVKALFSYFTNGKANDAYNADHAVYADHANYADECRKATGAGAIIPVGYCEGDCNFGLMYDMYNDGYFGFSVTSTSNPNYGIGVSVERAQYANYSEGANHSYHADYANSAESAHSAYSSAISEKSNYADECRRAAGSRTIIPIGYNENQYDIGVIHNKYCDGHFTLAVVSPGDGEKYKNWVGVDKAQYAVNAGLSNFASIAHNMLYTAYALYPASGVVLHNVHLFKIGNLVVLDFEARITPKRSMGDVAYLPSSLVPPEILHFSRSVTESAGCPTDHQARYTTIRINELGTINFGSDAMSAGVLRPGVLMWKI